MLLAMDDATCNTTIPVPTYHTWLQDWNKHMEGATSLVSVPSSARQIHTPLVICTQENINEKSGIFVIRIPHLNGSYSLLSRSNA